MMARSALNFDVGVSLQTTLASKRKGFEDGVLVDRRQSARGNTLLLFFARLGATSHENKKNTHMPHGMRMSSPQRVTD